MKKKFALLILAILMMVNSITVNAAQSNIRYDVDFTRSEEGIVQVLYNTGLEKKIKLIINNGDDKYIYNLANNEHYINFPLQLGDGNYSVKIYENTTGTSYKKVYSETQYVDIKDLNQVYINSIQEVNWNEEDEAIIFAQELLNEALKEKKLATNNEDVTLTDKEIIEVVYNYIIENIVYDYGKINNLEYNYIPDIDEVLENGSGICYDYAALLSAMLRSQGIPTKLIKGYSATTSVYHAWNEVYLANEERWIIIDTTYDAYMHHNGLDFGFEKASENYAASKVF